MAPSEIADENVLATSQDISSQPIPANWRHKRCTFFGRRLSVVSLDGGETFLIGVQIAALLKRETFNMYRSMKIKNVNIQRATPLQVEFLAKCSAVRTGTHSVTLIPHTEGLYFIADAWSRQHKGDIFPFLQRGKGLRNFLVERPQLHRRKPCPWDVHRAIKKTELARCPSNTADFMSTIAVSKTSATPLEGSPAASPSYHTPLSASLSSLTSSHHSDFESDSEASDMETGLATKSTPASAADNAVHSLAALCHRSPILPTPYPANSANSSLSVPCQMYSFDNLQPNFFHNFANQQFSYCS